MERKEAYQSLEGLVNRLPEIEFTVQSPPTFKTNPDLEK